MQKIISIETDKLHIKKLKANFESQESFRTKDIALFYQTTDSNITETAINWRIYSLIQKGIIERVGKGVFKIGKNQIFIPEITSQQKTIYRILYKKFPFSKFCIWNTSVLNEFSLHQSNLAFTLIEVEKESLQAVFYDLQENNKNVFLEPSNEVIENYLLQTKSAIIVKTLISEAPIQIIQNIPVPTIEKILVDLFCDRNLFYAYQGKELHTIFQEAFSKYTVNQNKILRYSNRRGKKEEFIEYLKNQFIGNK